MAPSDQTAFDSVLASKLFPAAVQLAQLATVSPTTATATAIRADPAIQEQLSTLAATLKRNLATLSTQAESLPAGQLSLEDQDWLIDQLEARVNQSRLALAQMAELCRLDSEPAQVKDDSASAAVPVEAVEVVAAPTTADDQDEDAEMDMVA